MVTFVQFTHHIIQDFFLIPVLIAGGIFFTLKSRFIQFSHFFHGFKLLFQDNKSTSSGISSWQSFCVASAARVGTGNIAGVVVALTAGGPGAIFWMWVIAVLNMPTALVESTLSQVYKTKVNGQFRGGPAYYMRDGLKRKNLGRLFSLMLIASFGMTFIAVQSNTIAQSLHAQMEWSPSWTGFVLVALIGILFFKNLRSIAQFTAIIVPVMACLYLLIAAYVMFTHLGELPGLFMLIVKSALGLQEVASGMIAYSVGSALSHGTGQGLFSNEAGMGSSANISASVDMKGRNPIEQGFIQMSGVVVDTLIICTATAAIVLCGVDLNAVSGVSGIELVQMNMTHYFGELGSYLMMMIICFFCFSTIIGNYLYSENNFFFLCSNKKYLIILKLLTLAMIYAGTVLDVSTVWSLALITSSCMALMNIASIIILSPDFETCLTQYLHRPYKSSYVNSSPSVIPQDKAT